MSPKRADTGLPMPGAVWLRQRPPRRGHGTLTRERVARGAVALLDQAGSAGLSMRQLAHTLAVHPTTLYWHVASRDELLDLALDAVFAEIELPDQHRREWSDDVRAFMHELRQTLLRHPWSGALISSRPLLGPHALTRSEFVYAALVAARFAGDDLAAAAASITNFVVGTVGAETAWHHDGEHAARHAMHEHLRRHAEQYPTLAALDPRVDDDWDGHFDRGANLLLLGLTHSRRDPIDRP